MLQSFKAGGPAAGLLRPPLRRRLLVFGWTSDLHLVNTTYLAGHGHRALSLGKSRLRVRSSTRAQGCPRASCATPAWSRAGHCSSVQRYRHPWDEWPKANGPKENAILEARWFCPVEKCRLPPLRAGDIVDCRGKVLSSGSGNTGSLGVTFVAWAQGACGVADSHVKNIAIVALPGGELTWAKLTGPKVGYISRSSPSRTASSEELEIYLAMLPEFLAESTASSVNSLLSRTPDPNVDVSPIEAETRQAALKERARQLRKARRLRNSIGTNAKSMRKGESSESTRNGVRLVKLKKNLGTNENPNAKING